MATIPESVRALVKAGFDIDDAIALRRAAMTLHRWFELECGDGNNYASWSIERDETTSKPYLVTHFHTGTAPTTRHAIPDREKGARKRIAAIMAKYPGWAAYIQGDPRGASLYIVRPAHGQTNFDIEQHYNQGIAVYQ